MRQFSSAGKSYIKISSEVYKLQVEKPRVYFRLEMVGKSKLYAIFFLQTKDNPEIFPFNDHSAKFGHFCCIRPLFWS